MADKQDTPGGDTPADTVVPELSEEYKAVLERRESTRPAREERKKKIQARRNKNREKSLLLTSPKDSGTKETEDQAAARAASHERARKDKVEKAKVRSKAMQDMIAATLQGRNLPPCKKCGGPLLQCECRRRKMA